MGGLRMIRINNMIGYGKVSTPPPPTEFIMTVKTDNAGTTNDDQFNIRRSGTANYNVETSDGQTFLNQTGDLTITFLAVGIYQIKITEIIRIFYNNVNDRRKILSVDSWGQLAWFSFSGAFYGCENLQILANDTPDLSDVSNLNSMFRACTNLVGENVVGWDVSNVENFAVMFRDATTFNQDISGWDVSNGTLAQMFRGATTFNQNLGNWQLRQSPIPNLSEIFLDSGMSTANYTDTIVGWANYVFENNAPLGVNMTTQTGMTFDRARSGGANFANAGAARDFLTDALGGDWSITNDTIIN